MKLKVKHLILALFFAFLIWTASSIYSIASYGNYSNEKPADGIVVLGAAVFENQPSPVFRERINHATSVILQVWFLKLGKLLPAKYRPI